MGMTIGQVKSLKVGDYVKRLCDGTSHIRLTAGKVYRIKSIDSSGNPVVAGDNGGDEYVFATNCERWELIEKAEVVFPSNYPEVASVFVSPGIQPENNLKLVLQSE